MNKISVVYEDKDEDYLAEDYFITGNNFMWVHEKDRKVLINLDMVVFVEIVEVSNGEEDS